MSKEALGLRAYMGFVDIDKAYDNVSRRSYGWCWRNMGWRESCLGQ